LDTDKIKKAQKRISFAPFDFSESVQKALGQFYHGEHGEHGEKTNRFNLPVLPVVNSSVPFLHVLI
jgi:hypothetical protein